VGIFVSISETTDYKTTCVDPTKEQDEARINVFEASVQQGCDRACG
jgi:hypothetical protein